MSYKLRAPTYDLEYAVDYDFDFVRSLINKAGCRILEVPCGTGRLSKVIAPLVTSLTIADIEPEMIKRAREAISRHCPSCQLEAYVEDMEIIDLGPRFDLIIIPREALQLLPHDKAAKTLHNLANHLVNGGKLFVDIAMFNVDKRIDSDISYYAPYRKNGAIKLDWKKRIGEQRTLTRYSKQFRGVDSIRFSLIYETSEIDVVTDRWESEVTLHRFDLEWIANNMPQNTRVDCIYGDYSHGTFNDASSRLLLIFQRITDSDQISQSSRLL